MTQKTPELDRLLHFTQLDNRMDIWLKAKDIRSFQRDAQNPIVCIVTTYTLTPSGFLAFAISEGCEDAVEQYNAALEGRAYQPTPQRATRSQLLNSN